jgi:nucleoside-diphosphate-sugar epimerase
MKMIVISGAAGFIGSHLKTKFEKEGYCVYGIDNFITSARVPGIVDSDICQAEIPPCDGILHFASPASPKDFKRYWLDIYRANIIGTQRVLEYADAWNCKVIFASSSEIYGEAQIHPQTENYHGNVNTLGTRAIYDESKRMGEALCSVYKRIGKNVRIVRIFNTYGARMPFDGRILDACKQSLQTGKELVVAGTGEQTRSFCYIDDTIEGIYKVYTYSGNEWVFNIGNPQEITINAFISTFEQLTGVTLPKTYSNKLDEPVRRKPDISRAIEHLGWTPQIPLYMGLAQTLKNEGIIVNED